jgi:hypothetical protein
VHAYLYKEGVLYRASIYLMSGERGQANEPLRQLEAVSETALEAEVRAWVDSRYPKT